MTDRAQFEALLEALINEDQETAKEIFHNIVVGKSREIYEELLSEDFDVEESCTDGDEDEESVDEAFDFADEDGEEDDSMDSDEDSDESESEEEGDSEDDTDCEEKCDELEDRVLDLEDALDELRAEFDELLAGEENEPEHSDMFGGEEEPESDMGNELDSEFVAGEEEQDEEFQQFMEYVNKVALPKHSNIQAKSTIAGKNDMGGTTANIAKSFSTTKGGTNGGLLNPSTKPQDAGNVNVPGNKKAPKLSPVSTANKGSSEKSVNDKSIVGGK